MSNYLVNPNYNRSRIRNARTVYEQAAAITDSEAARTPTSLEAPISVWRYPPPAIFTPAPEIRI